MRLTIYIRYYLNVISSSAADNEIHNADPRGNYYSRVETISRRRPSPHPLVNIAATLREIITAEGLSITLVLRQLFSRRSFLSLNEPRGSGIAFLHSERETKEQTFRFALPSDDKRIQATPRTRVVENLEFMDFYPPPSRPAPRCPELKLPRETSARSFTVLFPRPFRSSTGSFLFARFPWPLNSARPVITHSSLNPRRSECSPSHSVAPPLPAELPVFIRQPVAPEVSTLTIVRSSFLIPLIASRRS